MNESWRWKRFEELTDKGVRCISETADGHIVFGTNKGVIFYDGLNWRESDSIHGLPYTRVNQLVLSEDKRLFAGTSKGLFEYKGKAWDRIFPIDTSGDKKLMQNIFCLEKMHGGGIVASFGSDWNWGVFIYDKKGCHVIASQRTINTLHGTEGLELLSVPYEKCIDSVFSVKDVLHDNQNNFWIFVSRNFKRKVFSFKLNHEKHHKLSFSKTYSAADGFVTGSDIKFAQDDNDKIWAVNSTFYTGYSTFDGKNWEYAELKGLNSHLSIANINGNMWIGGFGVFYVRNGENWKVYERPLYKIPSSKLFVYKDSYRYFWIAGIQGEVIRIDYSSVKWESMDNLNFHCEDLDNKLWYIDAFGRVVVKKSDTWYWYSHKHGLPDVPVKIYCTRDGLICVAGSYQEKACIAFFNGKTWQRHEFPKLSWGIDYRAVFEDHEGNLWLGCSVNCFKEKGQRGGVVKIQNPGKNNQVNIHYLPDQGIEMTSSYGMAQSGDSTIWLGGKHLAFYKNNEWSRYGEIKELTYYISSMGNTTEGTLWVGSRRFGIFRYAKGNWSHFNTSNGLKNNTIISVLPVHESDVWIATNEDFSRFDGNTWTTELFHDDLTLSREQGNIQIQNNGTIWINKASRKWKRRAIHNSLVEKADLEYYSTISYKSDTLAPNTFISIYTKEIPSDGNTYIEWDGIDAWKDTPVSKLQYSYRLNLGLWSNFTKQKKINLLNLKSGEHTFEVRARDVDFNIDPTPAKINFTVAPSVWKQAWFIFLISSFLSIIVYYQTVTYRQNKRLGKLNTELINHGNEIEHKNDLLEKQKEQIIKQNILEKERHQSKIRFFTNISHEFRTPLTLVTGIIDNLSEQSFKENPKYFNEQLSVVKKNSKQLLHLIGQLMDFRKIENTSILLKVSKINITRYLKEVGKSFYDFTRKHDIELTYHFIQENIIGWIDQDKIGKVLNNLISNAIKFTPNGGKINIFINTILYNYFNHLEIIVEDTGTGISDINLKSIFEPFYQVENTDENRYIGTGIGLSIVYNYIKLHKGEMAVKSTTDVSLQEKQGFSTQFTIKIPIDKKAFNRNEIKKDFPKNQPPEKILILENETTNKEKIMTKNPDLTGHRNMPHILVVEDNKDLRAFLVDALKLKYKVFDAKNGEEGFKLSFTVMPDIIISDIMMPKMSGSELCQKVKSDFRTSHIPVILLTALTTDENIIEGFKYGADDYVTKPVSLQLLVARIDNILSIRKTLKQKFMNEEAINHNEMKVLSIDVQFIQNLKSILEENYSNSQFSVVELSIEVGLSQRQLLNKLRNLINISPVEYIKVFRLKKAARLLAANRASVSEIAYDTGFNDLSYFGKCFAKHYGMSPTDYIKTFYKENEG